MAEENALEIPQLAVRDPKSFEIIRAWVANNGLHVSLRTAVWDDPGNYGILLCDLMHHVANSYHQNEGLDRLETLRRIKAGFDAEFSFPTDEPRGR